MGCAASDMGITMSKQPTQQQPQQHYPHQQTRPVASVTPQQQQQQQHVVINTSNQEPVKQPTNQSAPPAPPQTTQPSAPPPAQEQSSNQNPVVVTRESIERYMALDRQIREAETRNPIKRLTAMKKALTDLQATEKQLLDNYNKCLADTAKEKADVDNLQQPNVRSFFKDQTLYDNKMSKEQEEYVEALNRQEVAQKEYIGVKEQRVQMEKDIAAGQNEADQLNRLYAEQDEMLGGFFDGNYGSELENRLEAELDMLLDRKQRVLVAKHKWQNGRLLIHHAVSQLAFGLQRWSWLTRIDPGNMPVRYQVATEARNNFIAASQNITNSQRYLSTIAFPYLKPDEIQTLNKATQHIYVDMQSQERYSHATECYTITHRRCAALLQWFDHVIDKTIVSDLNNAAQEAANKQQQLRSERLRLLQEKYTESSGETIQLEEGTVGVPEIPEADEQQLMALTEADKVSMAGEMPPTDGDNEKAKEPTDKLAPGEPARQPTPLPLSDLAPPPSEEDIFGNIESLRKQHEQQMQEFDRAQESNRARMEQGLNEKLRARRSRRARLEGMEE